MFSVGLGLGMENFGEGLLEARESRIVPLR